MGAIGGQFGPTHDAAAESLVHLDHVTPWPECITRVPGQNFDCNGQSGQPQKLTARRLAASGRRFAAVKKNPTPPWLNEIRHFSHVMLQRMYKAQLMPCRWLGNTSDGPL